LGGGFGGGGGLGAVGVLCGGKRLGGFAQIEFVQRYFQ
jgi:hypothetical protein